MLFHDLNTITKLSDGVNYRYWKFHLTTDPSCLFLFYEHHKKKYLVVKKKKPNESPNFFMIINAKTSQIEFSLLELFSKVLPIISHDKPLLLGLIQFLYRCAAAETEETMMIIFKPY